MTIMGEGRALKASSSVLAIMNCLAFGVSGAMAQDGDQGVGTTVSPASVDEIVVTASRISGFNAPTPTTVLGVEEIQSAAAPTVADVLNRLPSFSANSSPQAQSVGTANPGANYINLRNLGANRTLVLINGQRHVPTSDAGTVDINVVPSALIQRVEVVTGGASAAWGSDAVSGVVNFILDTDFTGFRGSTQTGVTQRSDDRTFRTTAAYGARFADGRGHFMVAGEYTKTWDTPYYGDRGWARNYQLLTNTNPGAGVSEPLRFLAPNVTYANMTYGGLINSGPLRGTQFLAGGVPAQFQYGTHVGTTFMLGGGGDILTDGVVLDVPSERSNIFARGSFELTPSITAALELSHSRSETMSTTTAPFDPSITVRQDNAFLSESVRDAMVANGLDTFVMGRLNRDMGFIGNGGDTRMTRAAFSLEGSFGASWNWHAYVQAGETDYLQTQPNNRNNLLWRDAIDAVLDPSSGQIVCRSTLANPGNGCLPLNIFGVGQMDPNALARVQGTAWFNSVIRQQAGGASISGEPFSLWAGPVSFATGVEYRREELTTTSDDISAVNGWRIGNFQPLSGDYDVHEVFAETAVPLLTNAPLAQSLTANGAVRYTEYSLSGGVTTWKLGLVYEPNSTVLVRATRSRDIRAPNIGELFRAGNQLSGGITDRMNNNAQYTVPSFTGGNPDLQPEIADTIALGVVLQPSFVPGLRLSVDWYDIELEDAITGISGQATIDRCFAGATAQCANITRDPTSGLITRIDSRIQNLASQYQRGVDIEGAYALPMDALFSNWSGDLSYRVLATYIDKNTAFDGVVTLRTDGQVGTPKWKVNQRLTYRSGPLSVYGEARWVDSVVYNNTFGPLDIEDNTIDSAYYITLSASYDFSVRGADLTAFGVVDNLLDRDPEIVGGTGFTSQTSPASYDALGRRFTVGLRYRF